MTRLLLLLTFAATACDAPDPITPQTAVAIDHGKGDGPVLTDPVDTYPVALAEASRHLPSPTPVALSGRRRPDESTMHFSWRFASADRVVDIGFRNGAAVNLGVALRPASTPAPLKVSAVKTKATAAGQTAADRLGDLIRMQLRKGSDGKARWVAKDSDEYTLSVDAKDGSFVDGDTDGNGVYEAIDNSPLDDLDIGTDDGSVIPYDAEPGDDDGGAGDDGGTDDGGTDDGGTDNGSTDDGSTDDWGGDDWSDGGFDDV